MSRAAINFVCDCWLLLCFMCLLAAAAIVQVIFPAGTKAASWVLWGLDYDAWCIIQFASLGVLTLSILLHLVLHWDWICLFVSARIAKFKNQDRPYNPAVYTLYGVGTLILILIILGAVLTAAEFSIQQSGALSTLSRT